MIYIVVPAYNEEANIAALIEETDSFLKSQGWPYKMIVVDDGSRDKTADIVREKSAHFPCEVIRYSPNQGVQEAFRQGFMRALSLAQSSDKIVTMEADRTADLELLKPFLSKIDQGADMVVASYYAAGGEVLGTVWYRKILSWGANFLIRTLFGVRGVSTYSSFYRMYRPQTLDQILKKYGNFYQEKGFACVVELLLRAHRMKFRVDEVPMKLEGSKRIGGSKMKVLQTIIGYLRMIRRNAFSKL